MMNHHYSLNTIYIKFIIFFFSFILILSNCKSKISLKDTDWQLLPIVVMTDSSAIYIMDNRIEDNVLDFYKKDLRLHVYINVNCNSCIDKLKSWKKIISDIEHSHDILFHAFSFDFNNFTRINNDLIKFHHPIIYDFDNTFFQENTHLNINLENNIILTDRSNRLIDFSTMENIDHLLRYELD